MPDDAENMTDINALSLPISDADPEAIEGFLSDTSEPPSEAEMPRGPAEPIVVPPAGHNRLSITTRTITAGDLPVQIANADPTRVEVHLHAWSETVTDTVLIAGVAADAAFDFTAMRLQVKEVDVVLSGYTGPLYAAPQASATGPVTISVTAVCR